MSDAALTAIAIAPRPRGLRRLWRRHPTLMIGGAVIAAMVVLAIAAPLFAGNPLTMDPMHRLRPPSAQHWFGTDTLGRDVFARTVFGARISLFIGLTVAFGAIAGGLVVGLLCGFYRRFDAVVMRVMDGLMAIPSILLAIALVSLWQGGVPVVILAILIPELPRDVRLVRSIVLGVRERPYVEAAIAGGARTGKVLRRHILPSTIAPLTVQGTYVCASAILVEAGLSFLGAGIPPSIPTWGNMIAGSELYLALAPWTIFCPGIALAVLVLSVNLLGDGLRDLLDPRLSRHP
ncbi:MAG TPA: ABC transporter permease [Acetobacteraceae bacterium]|jgi:peptide/nickel transport system permease protein|nr:ABC transporter permease [Acetobacteraceae bacterium]